MDDVDCAGYETSLTQCPQVGWGLGNCDPLHREDAGVVCGNTTVEEVSNNYCRRVNNGSCNNKVAVLFVNLDIPKCVFSFVPLQALLPRRNKFFAMLIPRDFDFARYKTRN